MDRVSRLENITGGAAVLAALSVPIALYFVPLYATRTSFRGVTTATTATIYDVNGLVVLLVLLLPAVLAAIPLAFQRDPGRRKATLVCGVVVSAFCVIAGFSVGLFYVPSAILMLSSLAFRTRAPSPGMIA